MITKNSPLQPLVMIVALLVSGLFVYDVLLAKNPVLKTSRERIETKTTEISAELPKEAKSARVEVNTGAIEFEIDSSTAKLLEGTLDSNVMRSDLKTTLKGDEVRAVLDTEPTTNVWFGGVRNKLEMALSKTLPIDLLVNSGASSLKFDLSENAINSLTIKAGASSIWTKLGQNVRDGAKIAVDSGASSVDFEIPEQIGVRITSDSGLSSHNFPGFEKTSEGSWESTGYNSATKKITITLKTGVSSISVNRY